MKNIQPNARILCCLFLGFAALPVQAVTTAASSKEALFAAAAAGNNVLIRRLLNAGVPVNAQGAKGTALVYAAEQGHLSTIKLLMESGAILHACDEESVWGGGACNRALYEAASAGWTDVVRFLLFKGVPMNGQNVTGYNPLLAASAGQHWDVVKLLLAHRAYPNYQTCHYQNSALMLASLYGRADIVKVLLRHGADVKAKDKYEHTALWQARRYKYSNIVRLLRAAGARE